MRRKHPLWRGFWLATVLVSAEVLLGGLDWLAAYRLDRKMLAMLGAAAVGAFLAALPVRIRRFSRGSFRWSGRTSWLRCLRAFLCGAAIMLSLGMAGSGRILPALMEGSVGAYAFLGTAWAAGFLTVRIVRAVVSRKEARE